MSYESIYAAAKNLDPIKLKQALTITCIDEWKPGTYYFSAASQLALENNKTAVNFLLTYGANITYVAIGAAMGGDLNTAKSLLKAGADVKWVAYATVLGGHIEFAKNLLIYNENVISFIAGAAARMGNKDSLMELLAPYPSDNEIIDKKFICMNAGISGNQILCDALLSNEIFPNFYAMDQVAFGVGFAGHNAYCERILTKCRAAIYYYPVMLSAAGAAMSGNKKYAEKLLGHLKQNTDILWGLKKMLEYTAQAGRRAYAEELYKRYEKLHEFAFRKLDLDIYELQHLLFRGAISGNHPLYVGEILNKLEYHRKNPNAEEEKALLTLDQLNLTQHFANRPLFCLSSYHFKFTTNFLEDLKYSIPQLTKEVETTILRRCLTISRLRYHNTSPVSYLIALVLTDQTCRGMLFLLMKLFMPKTVTTSFKHVPIEILQYIFNFVAPIPLNSEDLKYLAFILARTYLSAQLSVYQSNNTAAHKERAESFREAIISTKDKAELEILVEQQARILQGKNPFWFFQRDKTFKENVTTVTVDRYHPIIDFWNKEFKGEEIKPEPNTKGLSKFLQIG
jgi:hypothetical protein